MPNERYLSYPDLLEKILLDVQNRNIINNNGKLISEHEMMRKYNSSRYAIRKVLKSLRESGIIWQKQGLGSFILPKKASNLINLQENQNTNELLKPNLSISTKSINEHILCVSEADFLPKNKVLNEDLELIQIRILRESDKKPFVYEMIYFIKEFVNKVPREELYGSVFSFSKYDKALKIGTIDKFIGNKFLTKEERTILKTNTNTPLVYIKKEIFLKSGDLLCFSKEIYNSSDIEFYFSHSY